MKQLHNFKKGEVFMKKEFLYAAMAAAMAVSLAGCSGGSGGTTTAAATEASAEETEAEETTAAEEGSGDTAEKAPEDYTGTVVVYSPHDADP